MKELFKQWCEETKRNGSVLVSGSIYEFFEWMIVNNYTVIKGKAEQVDLYYEEGDGGRVAFLPKSKEEHYFKNRCLTEGCEEDIYSKLDRIYNENGVDKVKALLAVMND